MTQIESAKKGIITEEMKEIARQEGLSPEFIRDGVAKGEIVILTNSKKPPQRLVAVGKGLRTKVNANIGSSEDYASIEEEVEKARVAEEAGADTIMDLSTGGDLRKFRLAIREAFKGPMGTVPIYEAAINSARKKGGIIFMTEDDLFSTIEQHAKDGVNFVTVHCGVTLQTLERLKRQGRITDVVSRGGAFHLTWMVYNKKENPLYQHFDRLLEIAHEYDLTLSLGDGLRPGSIADSTDRAQIQELILLGELKERANKAGVQVMIEGPGHLMLNEIHANIMLEKKHCGNAPFYVLGPIVTDIAPGYDHITSAVGAALAASYGADFICYVTPTEHVCLPTKEDVKIGVISARIAAHIGDLVKGVKGAFEWDLEMSKARKSLNWRRQEELAIDPYLFKKLREERPSHFDKVCSMCGEYCAIKLVKEMLEGSK